MSSVSNYEDPLLSNLGWFAVVLVGGVVGRTWDLKAEDLGLSPSLSCVTLDKTFNLSELLFPCLQSKLNKEDNTYWPQNDSKDYI